MSKGLTEKKYKFLATKNNSAADDHGKEEEEDLYDEFKYYVDEELNWWPQKDFSDPDSGGTRCVFWSREDDQRELSLSSDNSGLITKIFTTSLKFKETISSALQHLVSKSLGEYPLLIQFWAFMMMDGRSLLTTRNQPFALTVIDKGRDFKGLCSYRMISKGCKFYVDGKSEDLGLPGRVFLHRLPESTPNVEYYSVKEYPQRDRAFRCQVRASLALPVFDLSGIGCVGVLELVSTARYACLQFLEEVSINNAFQVVGLNCSNLHVHRFVQEKNEALTFALDEIWKVLDVVCEIHDLPLAQTWVPCTVCRGLGDIGIIGVHRNRGQSHLMDENAKLFLRVCELHHLGMGQGVVGRAFSSRHSVLCTDVSLFSIAEYPLAHYAREVGFSGSFATCLQSSYTGNELYVLEFFPSTSNKADGTLLRKVLGTMKKHFRTFKLASGEELGGKLSIEVIDFQNGEKLASIQISLDTTSPPRDNSLQSGREMMQLDSLDQPPIDTIRNLGFPFDAEQSNSPVNCSQEKAAVKRPERKRIRDGVRIRISLEDILLFSEMNLEEAAKNLGVSRSTLKRLCRVYNIHRWPPRKMSNVTNSPSCLHRGDLEHTFQLNELDSSDRQSIDAVSLKSLQNRREMIELDSSDQQSIVCINNATNIVSTEQCNVAVNLPQKSGTTKTSGRKCKSTGVSIEIPYEDILAYSKLSRNDAAKKLKVSIATFKRVCRNHGISRWPPRNVDKAHPPQPERVDHQEEITQLSSNLHSNQPSASVAHTKPHNTLVQDTNMVTTKAKYLNDIIKFRLSLSSGLVELQHQVAKRLNLESGTYYIKYVDEENVVILIACDEDLQDYMHTSRSLGRTSIVVLVEPK